LLFKSVLENFTQNWLMSSQNVPAVAGLDATPACAFLLKSFQLAPNVVRLQRNITAMAPQKQCAVAGLGVASACAFILKQFQLTNKQYWQTV